MSLTILTCPNCREQIWWKKVGDTVYSIKKRTLVKICPQCCDHYYNEETEEFCSEKCFKEWIEREYLLPNPSKRRKK